MGQQAKQPASKLPARPYKNLREFIRKRYFLYRGCDYPCVSCEGRGRYQNSEDRDPYEGYKLAPWYICEACQGTGEGPRKPVYQEYKNEIDRWKAAVKETLKVRVIIDGIRKKLTPEELKVLGLCSE